MAVVVETGQPVGDRQLGEARVQRLQLARALDDLLLQRRVQRRQLGVLRLQLAQQLGALALQAEARQEVLDRQPQVGLVPGLGDVLIEPRLVDGVDHRVQAGLPGEQDLHRLRAAPVDLLEQLDALHARHDLVGDHHRQLLAVLLQILHQVQRLARVLGDRDVALAAEARGQLLAQRREDALLVVDAEDVLAECVRAASFAASIDPPLRHVGAPASSAPGPSIGSLTSKRVRPGRLSTRIVPPCFSTMRAEIDRPRPVPSPLALVVKNGSKMRGRHLGLDARARVLDRHLHVTFLHLRLDQNLAPPVHGLNRVVDEVGPHLVELADVRRDRRQRPE